MGDLLGSPRVASLFGFGFPDVLRFCPSFIYFFIFFCLIPCSQRQRFLSASRCALIGPYKKSKTGLGPWGSWGLDPIRNSDVRCSGKERKRVDIVFARQRKKEVKACTSSGRVSVRFLWMTRDKGSFI